MLCGTTKDQFVANVVHLTIKQLQMYPHHHATWGRKWPKFIANFMVLMMIVIK